MSKILIIDDDPDVVQTSKIILEANDYNVVSAENGETGFAKAQEEKPDLILLDVMMTHDTEGFEIARKLKENQDTKNIPVILVTGIRKEKTMPFKFEPDEDWLPVKEVLEKPLKSEDLLKIVKENIQPVEA